MCHFFFVLFSRFLTNDVIAEKLAEINANQRSHFEQLLRHGAACGVVDPASIDNCIDFLVMVMRTISEEIPTNPDKSYSEIWALGIKGVISGRLGY